MRRFVAAAVTVGTLVAAPAALATNTFKYFNAQKYEWDTAPTATTNHGQVAPQAGFTFDANGPETFADHPLVWDTGDFANTSAPVATKAYTAPLQPGFYAFHCSIHGTAGTEGSVGSGMAGYLVVGTDQHATPDFSASSPANTGSAVTFTYTGTADPDTATNDAITHYLWDLDGNGSFETSTTAPTASATYAHSGGVNVSLKVIDKGHEFSDVVTHAVNVQDAAGPGGGPNIDNVPPTIAFGKRVTKVRKGKLKVRFTTSEAGSADALLKRGKKRLGHGHAKFAIPGPHVVTVRLNRAARRTLHRLGTLRTRVTLTVLDAAGNKQTASRTLQVREAA
ncbi:MAG: hypothetical protein QOF37_2171 [Thermoleophilaceae bacterium]|jgi:hypothetical protein|nr:hypothetical protein [Thermoleophilaceae bacterium]